MSNRAKAAAAAEETPDLIETSEAEVEGEREISATELKAIAEALIFVAEEPVNVRTIADVLGVDQGAVSQAIESLVEEYGERPGGLQLREIAGGLGGGASFSNSFQGREPGPWLFR